MKKAFLMVAAAAAMLVTGFTACKSNSPEPPEPPKPPLPKEIDIYVAGYTNSGADDVAKVWKNKKAVFKTDGSNYAQAVSVYVVGEDVYVTGIETKDSNWVVKVWKNKEELYALADNGIPSSIVVHNGDVYMAGFELENKNFVAKVWKNGKELYTLADKGGAFSIFITERK